MIDHPTPPSFGEWLKSRRRHLDLTQAELAKQVGCARVTIHKLESDDMRPSKQLADLLANALQIPATEREAFLAAARGTQWLEPPRVPVPTAGPTHTNLPTQLTSFIGRESEIAEVRRLLGGTRLLTLMGAGGVGKTRLALQVAADELATYPDGVWLAELAPLADPALIANTIASSAGVREEPNRPMLDTLGDYFRAKTALVVLDNCEHLIADAAQVCDSLLHTAPRLKIIATSREALGIGGEHAYRVPSLGLPTDSMTLDALSHVASVQLFTERARAARGDFALTTANAPVVAQICRRLDGIPLALELAAARVRNMTVEQIAARLDDRFRLLTGGSRTALPRQQTLRAMIDWSYRLLSEPEKTLLRRLSVFAGGWTLEAAEAVCVDPAGAKHSGSSPNASPLLGTDILDLLSHLVDRSLVTLDETGDEPRYRMLETIRQFAREELNRSDEVRRVRDAHLKHFLGFARRAEHELESGGQVVWLQRCSDELDNIRVAIEWATGKGDIDSALKILNDMGLSFWQIGNRVNEWLSVMYRVLGNSSATISASRAIAYGTIAMMEYGPRNLDAGDNAGREGLRLAEICNDPGARAWVQLNWGRVLYGKGHYAQAQSVLEESMAQLQMQGRAYWVAAAKSVLAAIATGQSEHLRAEALRREVLEIVKPFGVTILGANALGQLGRDAVRRDDYKAAASLLKQGLTQQIALGQTIFLNACISDIGGLALARGDCANAARIKGACTAWRMANSLVLNVFSQSRDDQDLTSLKERMGPAALSAVWDEGLALTLAQAIALAWEVLGA
ncbi:MAG: XRE family transcriptional regulator [Chloroflexi bacterium]|nr:XRE family transcriptional regulator [Chloroflexota bacterium]